MTLDSTGTVATFAPANSLTTGTTYTVTISGAQGHVRPGDDNALYLHIHHKPGIPHRLPMRYLARRATVRHVGWRRHKLGGTGSKIHAEP